MIGVEEDVAHLDAEGIEHHLDAEGIEHHLHPQSIKRLEKLIPILKKIKPRFINELG
jgi:Mn-dependent DtxR family transcriptional regulator